MIFVFLHKALSCVNKKTGEDDKLMPPGVEDKMIVKSHLGEIRKAIKAQAPGVHFKSGKRCANTYR